MSRVLCVIPCFNEEDNVEQVVLGIRRSIPYADILVVDDGSKDNTSVVASKFANVVKLPVNLGIGGAVQTGIKYAAANGYDFCFQVDGDNQHRPEEIHKFFSAYRDGEPSLVIGSRFLGSDGFKSTAARRVGIFILRTLAKFVTGKPLSDPTSGFRMLDRRAIELFSKDYPLDFPEPISLVIASENGLKIKEIPTLMRAREHGTSSIKPFSYMVRVIFYMLFVKLRRYL